MKLLSGNGETGARQGLLAKTSFGLALLAVLVALPGIFGLSATLASGYRSAGAPPPPEDVTANLTTEGVRVTWDTSDAWAYNVYVDGDYELTTSENSYWHKEGTARTNYSITAIDGQGRTGQHSITVSSEGAIPSSRPVLGIKEPSRCCSGLVLELHWDPPPHEDPVEIRGYAIYKNGDQWKTGLTEYRFELFASDVKQGDQFRVVAIREDANKPKDRNYSNTVTAPEFEVVHF